MDPTRPRPRRLRSRRTSPTPQEACGKDRGLRRALPGAVPQTGRGRHCLCSRASQTGSGSSARTRCWPSVCGSSSSPNQTATSPPYGIPRRLHPRRDAPRRPLDGMIADPVYEGKVDGGSHRSRRLRPPRWPAGAQRIGGAVQLYEPAGAGQVLMTAFATSMSSAPVGVYSVQVPMRSPDDGSVGSALLAGGGTSTSFPRAACAAWTWSITGL